MASKFVLLAALCAAYVQGYPNDVTAAAINKFKATVDKCKTELNASPEAVNLIGQKVLPTDESQRCFLECVYSDLNLLKDSKFVPEVSKEFAKARYPDGGEELTHSHATIDKVDACMKESTVTDKCDAAKNLRICFFKFASDKKIAEGMF